MSTLTHLNERGEARMVDISHKRDSVRSATAVAQVVLGQKIAQQILEGQNPKGDVLATARIAGIQAAKKCSDLIPLCHPLALTSVVVEIHIDPDTAICQILATCKVTGATGVEMEALTAASVAALTLYDMCKAVDKGICIQQIRLLEKSGGKSGHWQSDPL